MEKLGGQVLEEFLQGNHVMRHQPGLWNGIWSDMFIESTFMRYGHSPGGIIGITLKPSTLKRWALSLHICSQLVKDVTELRENHRQNSVTVHKEEMPSRIQSDGVDREKLKDRLSTCIDPLQSDDHPPGLLNIVTGGLCHDRVNVDASVSIGIKQMKEYELHWPESFNKPLTKQVVLMSISRKQIKIGQVAVYDTNLIYSRVLGLQNVRDVNLKDILMYELAAVPPSMFEDSGDMRITKSKSVLKKKLQVEVSERLCPPPDAIIVDGCAVLWVIQWPTSGTVEDYIMNLMAYVERLLQKSDTYLIFDRYYVDSIKNATRLARAGKEASRRHQLNLNTPLPSQKVTLTVTENKVQLIKLTIEYIKEHREMLPVWHKLVITGPDPIPLEIHDGVARHRTDLTTTHEEADVIIAQQMTYLGLEGVKSIHVISDDTDVMVLLLHFYTLKKLSCNLLMVGTSHSRASVDIKATAKEHTDYVPQILAAHTISGCDTVSYLWGIGKGTVLKMLKAGYQLNRLGFLHAELPDVTKEATRFYAACYGLKDTDDMSTIRYGVWSSKMANTKLSAAPDLKSLPPTSDAFQEHVKRAHYQAAIWRASLDPNPPTIDPSQYGWSRDQTSNMLVPVPLPPHVSPAPVDVLQMIRCGCSSNKPCSTMRCSCSAAKLSCSMFCGCHGMAECQNDQTKFVSSDDADDICESND